MSKFSELTSKLGSAYDAYKAAEKNLGTSKSPAVKQEFFDEATKAVASETLATKTVVVEAESSAEASAEATRRNPRWEVSAVAEHEDSYSVALTENPKYKPYTFVNKEDKRVWKKSVVDGSPTLDEEALQASDPELWDRVTVSVRQLLPLEELDPSDLAQLESYIYPGKPIIKLDSPRKAKSEELDG